MTHTAAKPGVRELNAYSTVLYVHCPLGAMQLVVGNTLLCVCCIVRAWIAHLCAAQ